MSCGLARLASGLRRLRAVLQADDAAQLAEFAVSVPLLVVFVVGIWDFGNAFNLKYKLIDATREGARFAANEPTADLSNPNTTVGQGSIAGIPKLVGSYLLSENVNDCGLSSASPAQISHTSGTLMWTYQVNTGCPGTLILTIDRGATFTTAASPPVYVQGQVVEATQLTLTYPYRWQFVNVIKLIAPNASYATNTTITTSAAVQNLN